MKVQEIFARSEIAELKLFHELIQELGDQARVETIAEVSHKEKTFPIEVLHIGSNDPKAPVLAFFGGVHGLEKIGSEVVLAHLEVIVELMKWDESFRDRLKKTRLLFMPVVNPIGILLRSRSNGNGVDLMRNAPIDGEKTPWLVGGHRLSQSLPWYRGDSNKEMEIEAQALCEVVEKYLFPAQVSMAIDVHSGFGALTRLWFPYAGSRQPFPYLSEIYALKKIFDQTYPNHFYKIEPICLQYTINGDLWDYLSSLFFKLQEQGRGGKYFLPFTLEMGSWMWLRKNPVQVLSRLGLFHPMKPHRHQRIMRRHLTLFDFLHRSLQFHSPWSELTAEQRVKNKEAAIELWYGDHD